MNDLIQCRELTKYYGKNRGVSRCSLSIPAGKLVGLLGPNGSGKTTLIKLMCGLLTPEEGEILIGGKPVGVETKAVVSYLPERPYFPDTMRIRDTLEFFGDFYRDFQREKAEEMLAALELDAGRKISALSKGNREKLQLILVMSRRAKVYLLDEPMGGVDPAARDFILRTILNNYSEDASVLLSTHLIADVENMLDDVIFIKNGSVVLHQSVDEIRDRENKSVDALFREVFAC